MKPRSLPLLFTLALLLPLIPLTPSAVAYTNYLEDFEDDGINAAPAQAGVYTFSSSGSGDFRVTNAAPTLGDQSYLHKFTGGSGTIRTMFDFSAIDLEFCGTTIAMDTELPFISFQVRFVALPDVNNVQLGFTNDPTLAAGASWYFLEITSVGAVNAKAQVAGVTGTAALTGTVVVNEWYTVTMGPQFTGASTCSGFIGCITGSGIDSCGTANQATTQADMDTFMIRTSAVASLNLRMDNYSLTNGPDTPPTAVGEAATSSTFTGMNGFSMDRGGQVGIVRYDSGDDITTVGGTDLASIATEDTDCTRGGNVMAQNTPTGPLVFYTDCEAGGNPDTWKIRNQNLAVPSLHGCGDACADIDTNEFASTADDDLTEFAQVDQFPIDLSVTGSGNLGVYDLWKFAWAWSGQGSRAGEVGIAVYNNCQFATGCDDDGRLARVNFGGTSGAVADDICTGIDSNGFYLAVADSTAQTRIYPVTFSNDTIGDDQGQLRANIGVGAQIPINGGIAIACGGPRIAVATATQVSVWNRTGGSAPLWTEACTCKSRGVALSGIRPDAKQFVLWFDGNTGYIAHATNETKVGSISFTMTGYTQAEMDALGTNAFVASGNVVKRFPIFEVTGLVSSQSQDADTDSDANVLFPDPSDNSVFPDSESAHAWSAILLVIFTGVIVGGTPASYQLKQNQPVTWTTLNTVLLLIGMVLGFGLAWLAFDLIPDAVAWGLIVLSIVGIGLAVYMRGR